MGSEKCWKLLANFSEEVLRTKERGISEVMDEQNDDDNDGDV